MPWSSHHGLAEEPPGSVLDPKQSGNWQARLLLVPEVVCVPCAKMKPRLWERGPCAWATLVLVLDRQKCQIDSDEERRTVG